MLGVPIRADEFGGEPIEEVLVRDAGAEGAEVVGAFDEAVAEAVLPEAIDPDAGSEGMVGVGDPLGESEAGAWRGGFFRIEDDREGDGDFVAQGVDASAFVDAGCGDVLVLMDAVVGDAGEGAFEVASGILERLHF